MKYHFNQNRPFRLCGAFGMSAILWLGVLIGVSFIATPVKFQAGSLDLPTALDVGQVTFALSTKVEWGLWALLIGAAVLGRGRRLAWVLVGLLGLALIIQSFWLLPILDARVERIIAGLSVEPAPHHWIYIVVEGLKCLLLLASIGTDLRRVRAEAVV